MKTQTKIKFILFLFIILTCNVSVMAGDTIRMINPCVGLESHTIIATFGKQFAVDWGDGSQIETFTGIEPLQALKHTYSLNPGRYKVTISGAEDCFFTAFWAGRSDTLDLSSCSSIKKVTKGGTVAGSLRSINARNCVNLEELELGRVSDDGNLSVLDLRDNVALRDLRCPGNQILIINNYLIITNRFVTATLLSE